MKKILLVIVIPIVGYIVHQSINTNLENLARAQNNFNLEAVKTCIAFQLNEHNNTKEDFRTALDICAKNIRSVGITGNMFVIRRSDKKLFWDSLVSEKECNKRNMTKDSFCSTFSEPETCVESVNEMVRHLKDGKTTWQYDDSIEFIDYKYIKQEIGGKQYLIGQGAQKDELFSFFNTTHISVVSGVILVLLISTV